MRWSSHDRRRRRLREFDGQQLIAQQRRKCVGCKKVVTNFDPRVVPRYLYSRAVITGGLEHREAGKTWERAAAASTADGQLDPTVLKRWHRRFHVDNHCLVAKPPPVAPFRGQAQRAMLVSPVGSRSPDLSQEDHWAGSPPPQP